MDSVLLANFADVADKTRNIIDLGTGNAPIPLILSTKTKEKIIGVKSIIYHWYGFHIMILIKLLLIIY